MMTCMNEVNDWYDFVDVQMTKINALVLWFFHITMHSPFRFMHCSDEKITGCVHWFLSFALQQNHIQSLINLWTKNQCHSCWAWADMQKNLCSTVHNTWNWTKNASTSRESRETRGTNISVSWNSRAGHFWALLMVFASRGTREVLHTRHFSRNLPRVTLAWHCPFSCVVYCTRFD